MKKVITIVMTCACLALCACGSKKKEVTTFDFSQSHIGPIETGNLRLAHGDLLSINQNESKVVIKAKITSNLTNEMTINQNYYNVSALIRNNGFNTCSEIEYWAVADMTSGDESKVIQFTVPKDVIDKIYSGAILDNQVGDHVTDLWILPSLQK